ncbi:MAG: hypothetical protein N4J56_007070 [Chroococcidiopsis sp. SAG 2025]|uniref:hypothetical protein n=1 Tax=Chroococcidiopsis sp. SAG 2025 TaxID=171389 RepID=UPI002936E030|nr:hypothetical protein [Chroococcidiopsis sp. SAG 2025]MDV2997365.1 hypothetical protein [Chroococcidiopsis sp. SAG 2025]
MHIETLVLELEPEDLELLANAAKETGKSPEQLVAAAIRAMYGSVNEEAIIAFFYTIKAIIRDSREISEMVQQQKELLHQISN